jgi:hypothetical protein
VLNTPGVFTHLRRWKGEHWVWPPQKPASLRPPVKWKWKNEINKIPCGRLILMTCSYSVSYYSKHIRVCPYSLIGKLGMSGRQWSRGLKRGSAATRLLELWVPVALGHECLSLVSVVCCQVQVFASVWSLVQRCSPECGMSSECDREVP